MTLVPAPLLERRPVFRSRDIDETRAFLKTKEFSFEVGPRAALRANARLNGVYLPSSYLGYIQYGIAATVRANPARNDYWVQLPLRGAIEAKFGRESIICDPRRAIVESPTRHNYYFTRSEAAAARIHLCLWKGALLAHLAALLGEPPRKPLEFAPSIDLTAGYGRSLSGYLLMAANDLDEPGSALLNPITMTAFEQLIMTGLLLSHQHSYSEQLRDGQVAIAPRDVKRAVDYMQAHLDGPITIAEIVKASGVPGRTLFKHFRDCHGVSPMRYVRSARFDQVREALLRAELGDGVTAIAASWGFSHMGRFSVEYRQRFGESPSQTLRGRRIVSPGWRSDKGRRALRADA